jgi:hypothetical protein
MAVHVLPDAEKLVIDWALATDEVNDLVNGRIYSALPASPEFPAIRIVRFGGGTVSRRHWLDAASMQVDVWGGPKSTARLVIATFLAQAANSLPGTHPLGVVSAVETSGPSWGPDDSYTPARPRYRADLRVTVHP